MFSKLKTFCINKYAMMLLALTPSAAFADSGTTLDTVLDHLLTYLNSTIARTIAVLAIVGVGYATFHEGKLSKTKGLAAIFGIGLIFGGSALVNMLTGG